MRVCLNCGKKLRTDRKYYCSRICRAIVEASIPKEDRAKLTKPILKTSDWEIIIEGMEREHLSYGEYVAKYNL